MTAAPDLADWRDPPPPPRAPIDGRWARLEPLDPAAHAPALHAANSASDAMWRWLPYGPFPDGAAYREWAAWAAAQDDPLFFTVIDRADGLPKGVATFMRITPAHGVIELGHIAFSPSLQRTRVGTEALASIMRRAFGLGYRRFEWKCDAGNAPSRRLAQRLGLSFEGVFRSHMIVKGRNRDTAWFAATDADFPAIDAALTRWLDPANFDAAGRQRESLSDLTRPLRLASDAFAP
ncbi:GNAT family N-acetyltransferase [Rubrimonas cliftonensis]|uniref:Protein N-acetyltransferase, RimJ/RimL family n=1 Tax=Rubrimonas cliftonensis TaxID=89524 RepID=A0A1H3VFY3_9RHOB|nr:GNAT family protein [Rubrimonas cliftonensis]SDZ73727.1 Protein N-acetyltransferase, RimJ/RimL family [Rubrimonas cliftonensis]